ncbi:cysteine/O-acetylserine efflux protein [Oxobacter pfennigii]|uniref:Cysteine/O-acetylserine efflux protein n=1 Tax=Oxobacter pfennigii TaxID=36849 RepID=A0A0N8NTW8_9CLOT|nr:LysE family transporter [Oxobacter pfennigii]KPU45992.1 cysteine/O-acetylserine efflux protein [Oxobacter pfennigii]
MNVIAFLIYCVIVTFTPGPTNIAILSIAHNFKINKAFQYVLGAAAALGTLLAASVILNSVLAVIVPKILIVMQIIGSLYMLYLAYQVSKMDVAGDITKQTATFMSGFLMQFVNPKVWVFTMTVIPSYVMPYYKSLHMLLIFVLAITTIALSALATWAFFGTVFKKFLQKYQKPVNITLAILLIYSAIEVSGIVEIIRR